MQQLTATDPRVVSFYNSVTGRSVDADGRFIGSAKSTTGYLYVIGNSSHSVQVVLPESLLEFANASSGTMSGKRPVGIRAGSFNSASAAADFVSTIFSSPASLAKFINSSECDAGGYASLSASAKKALIANALTDDRPVKDSFYDAGYDFSTLKELRGVFSQDTVSHDWNILTLNEFELRYGLI